MTLSHLILSHVDTMIYPHFTSSIHLPQPEAARLSLPHSIDGVRFLLRDVDAPENIEAGDRTRWV